ncbi:MAG: ATP-binding protein [Anaerolineales bacterium]|jgi:hypothetical protein
MDASDRDEWLQANQRYLMAALSDVRAALERHASGEGSQAVGEEVSRREHIPEKQMHTFPPALDVLSATFGLSSFERDVLLMCAGMELDSSFSSLCAKAQGDQSRVYPTFSLALAALPGAHWSALSPDSPLRYWRLIETGGNGSLTQGALRIDERVLHYLTGVKHLDERLMGFVEPVEPTGELAPSHQQIAERLVGVWSGRAKVTSLSAVQLCGEDSANLRAIAAAACDQIGLGLHVMSASVTPLEPRELEGLIRLWEREALFSAGALLLECGESSADEARREGAILHFIETIRVPLIVAGRERHYSPHRPLITLEVSKPTVGEQRALWQSALGQTATSMNGQVDALVSQFDLSSTAIQAVCAEALGRGDGDDDAILWDICRVQTRPRLDNLAQRIQPIAHWDDLVLPEAQKDTLRKIAVHVRQRMRVYEAWGFAAKSNRGLGISALFAGASGTGKTMAGEVLANELRLDLYRIDLSQVVSKYIGETEKNLRQVFDAAEDGGAILLFDEADALFGKRSEVKDSHDRYANIEISYLLQRMESYRGLAILTTNMKSALDTAFLRRIRFIVHFPFPDALLRAKIWERVFPEKTPTEALDMEKLARLNVTGGNIRNIALHAAFLAAESEEPVRMGHLLRAARDEYAKLEKSLIEAETRGWV